MESLLLPLLSLLFIFFFLQFPSPALTQDGYFISCGSDGNATVDDGRVFAGDYKSSYLSGDGDNALKDTSNSNSNSLYHTARVFTRTSSYKFPINSSRTHVVRLHFFPFISHGYNLSSAVFDVSVSGDFLFRNFTADTNKNVTLKEYFLKVKTTKLEISFTPTWKSSFAFVNAVEVFPAPDNLISDTAQLVGPTGTQHYNGLFEKVLETIHRINVGGPKITDSNLWRSWIPDEQFLVLPQAAKPATRNAPIINWGIVTRDIAPENVYNTAQQMNRDNNSLSQNFNISWGFGVSSDSKYLVRLHFCDIVSEQLDELYFHVYIGDSFAIRDFHFHDYVFDLAAPYYADFVADPDNLSQIKIGVGPSEKTTLSKQNAILNGVEIMKIIGSGVSRKNPRKLSIGVLVGAVVGVSAFSLLLVVVSVLVFKCWRKTTAKPRSEESVSWLPVSVHERSSRTTLTERTNGSDRPNKYLGLKMSLTDLRLATENFHETSLIGSGGFGNVYRGVLQDGTIVAVKRGKPESRQGLSEFVAEITVFSQIRHRHLVSLIGYCEEQSEMILVYEFMENGTLKRHLYGSNLPSLSWKQRIQICIDSARGLHYLHTGSAKGIIHRDVKTANILLDKNYSAKVADFGLSKPILSLDQSHITTVVKGTFGYLDPEYYKRRQLTEKSDVYSFGVVLLEVLCARPAIDVSLPRDQVNIAEWALESLKKGLLEQIIDRRLVGQINPISLRKFMETVQRCLSEYGADRPTIGDVLWNLEYVLQLQDIPVHREAYEDSAVSAVGPPLPDVRRVPSRSVQLESDDPSSNGNGSSETTASGVFSQLFGSDGR
ncbi:probable receptor-like protein kinase At5g24010 [Magnolia sinica]|uniref:probable receptor-like protein kinase At5g24010 n=1 Tax=Magnolia sinica TaxID=86752 RepID=UPI0026580C7F|nr:probable receptor-like protein kinase At5g24010 [Magnolia sinica]